ncbi:RDD family protein [Streptomyces sp. NPDC058405]|uniref:RDD family protein n=1 Tax=Streptomyces sp. NPDC058405 TaxID=3346482 RepID=UPI0036610A41
MATPPGDGGNAPREGFYPDPSIPGYVRYWNGAAWVPGTSRPAPEGSEVPPAGEGMPGGPMAAPTSPAVDETGPMFLDEDPPEEHRQEPASVWQADASRQTGFGGERDNRVSWGAAAGQDPRVPDPAPAPTATPHDVPPPTPGDPTGGALPGVRALGPGPDDGRPPTDGTIAIRAMRRGIRPASGAGTGTGTGQGSGGGAGSGAGTDRPDAGQDATGTRRPHTPRETSQPPVDSTVAIRALRAARRAKDEDAAAGRTGQPEGTMAIRALNPGASGRGAAPAQPQPQLPAQSQPQSQPVSSGAGGGAASWAQQVHQLAQPDQPVVPWKPPVNDPFLQAAQAQAAARPAGLGKRFVARLIDTVVLGAVVGAVAVPLVSKARTHIDGKIEAAKQTGETVTVWLLDGTTAGYLGGVLAALLVIGVLYEALPTAKWGRTLGKKLCGLEVRDIESHEAPAFGAALRRWLVYGVLGVLVVGVVNVLWCLIDRPWRQCWHDKAARTFVAG